MSIVKGVSYSDAWKEAAAVAPVDRVILVTLEFNHSTFGDQIPRIVADRRPFLAVLEADAPFNASELVNFAAIPVEVVLPEEGIESAAPVVTMKLDNVSGILTPYLDMALETLEPIKVIIREYASDVTTGPARLPPIHMVVRSATVGETAVILQAGYSDPTNTGFPSKEYIATQYPGLSAR